MQIEIFLLGKGDANRDILTSTGKGSLGRELGESKAGRIELRLPLRRNCFEMFIIMCCKFIFSVAKVTGRRARA